MQRFNIGEHVYIKDILVSDYKGSRHPTIDLFLIKEPDVIIDERYCSEKNRYEYKLYDRFGWFYDYELANSNEAYDILVDEIYK